MKWILPLLCASLYWMVAPVWYLALGRWKSNDWKEMVFGFCVLVLFSYVAFFGVAGLHHLRIPITSLGTVVVGILVGAGYVTLLGQFRKRINQKQQ